MCSATQGPVEGQTPRPLVLAAAWTREPKVAAQLAELMDRPVHCLEAPTIGPNNTVTRVPHWVDYHLKALEQLELEPPYLLLGWSFGGVIALEMARTLVAQDRPVAYVGLLDTIRPRIRPVLLRDAVPYHAREAALLPEGARVPYLRREARVRVGRRIPEPIQRARAASRVKRGRPKTSVRPADPASRAIRRAYLNYTSETIDLHVHEYVTDSSQRRAGGDPSLYWAPFFRGGFTVRHVPGKHFSMFDEPHINVLAATLEGDLRAAEAPPAPPATGSEPSG